MNWYSTIKIRASLPDASMTDTLTDYNSEDYAEGADAVNQELPEDSLQYILERFPNMKLIDAGANGIAYDIGGLKVLKLTTDACEFFVANKIINKKFPCFPKVYEVHDFGKRQNMNVYGIIMEKVRPLGRELTATEHQQLERCVQVIAPGKSIIDLHKHNVGMTEDNHIILFDLGCFIF